jgi:UDP-3-O-[3-hydroxymyristoyl] glucosamine N-acyltransferase
MADPRFYETQGPFTLGHLAELAGATLQGAKNPGAKDPGAIVRDVAPLEMATADDISFFDNARYIEAFRNSSAGACLVHPDRVGDAPATMSLLVSDDPYRGYGLVAQAFYPAAVASPGIAPGAVVDPGAKIGASSEICAGVVIGPRAEVGENCIIGANSVIGAGVILGNDVHIGACVTLHYCIIGSRVRILAGARIGEDGFGFAPGPNGPVGIPQIGRVIIGDDVEIGANTAIDRGAGPDTLIGEGTRIDNLVQIGHNVSVGRFCIIVGQVGIAGSATLEDFSVIAGQVGIAGHVTVGQGTRVGAQAGVTKDIPGGLSVVGSPAIPVRQYFRQLAMLQRLADRKGQ